jgi:hypothetical protein
MNNFGACHRQILPVNSVSKSSHLQLVEVALPRTWFCQLLAKAVQSCFLLTTVVLPYITLYHGQQNGRRKNLLEDPCTKDLREIVPVPEGVDKYNTLIVLGENNPHFGQFYHQMPVRQYNPFLLYFVGITCNSRD